MADPYLSEIRIFSFSIVPRGWMACNGQLLPISSNAALFSIIGTTYGGNGQTNFGLPNLQGRVPIHMGNGIVEGQSAGETGVTLITAQLPAHTHSVHANASADTSTPSGATIPGGGAVIYGSGPPNTAMNSAIVGSTGNGQAHTNMQPYLALNICICVSGIFPSRS